MCEIKNGVCDYINDKVTPNAKKTAQYICEKTANVTRNWADKLKKYSDSNCDNDNNCDNSCGCEDDF